MKKKLKLFGIILVVFMCFLLYKGTSSSFGIYRDVLSTNVYLSVLDPNDAITITFDGNGGTFSPNSDTTKDVSKMLNDTIGTLPVPERAGYNFIGYYTTSATTGGTKITPSDTVTGPITYYARWIKLVCKKAETGTLHTERCETNGGCTKLTGEFAYNVGDTITYGTIPDANSPKAGDAYDCDVNNDGVYNPSTERFYYVRSYNDDEKAVLVHYTSFDAQGQMDSEYRDNYEYDAGKAYLPDSTVWSNPALTTIDGKVSRYINNADIESTCGNPIVYNNINYLGNCQYLLENSRFQAHSKGRAGIWVEKVNDTLYRIQTESMAVQIPDSVTSKNTVRPVIEIPYDSIDGFVERISYNITLNPNQGTIDPGVIHRYENEAIGSLDSYIPTREGYNFIGWYDQTLENEYDPTTLVTDNMTLYAKWEERIDNLEYVFRIPGTCEFNGNAIVSSSTNDCVSVINPTNNPIDYVATSKKYIDTGIALYSNTNIDKDYEIGFTIDSYTPVLHRETFMNTKLEKTGYPGVVVRRNDSTDNILIQARETQSANAEYTEAYNTVTSVVIYRTNGSIYYSINGGAKTLLVTPQYNPEFNLTTWFGAGPTNEAGTGAQRHLTGTLSNMYIKLATESNTKYTITFNGNEGTSSLASKEVSRGASIGPSVLETITAARAGYAFDGWWTAANGGTKLTGNEVISADDTYYAHWKDIYQVTFHGENGTVTPVSAVDVADGESIGTSTLNSITATRSGYKFDGWWTAANGGNRVDGTETITGDTDYYAHWKQLFTVEFDGEGGTVSLSPNLTEVAANTIEVADGETIGNANITGTTATKSGSAFDGWYTAASGGTKITGNEPITGNTVYHAQYTTTCVVHYNGNGAEPEFSSKTVGYNQAIGTFPIVEKFNYTLDGWYIDDGTFNTQVTENTPVTENTYLIAKWTLIDYVAAIGNIGYTTIQAAIDAVPEYGSTVTTVRLLKDQLNQTTANSETSLITIDNGRKVLLDLQGHTVSTVASGNPKTVILKNGGELELTNGTITTAAQQATISDVATGTVFKANNVTITNTSSKGQAVYNNGGTVYIEDGTVLSNVTASSGSNRRAALHNLNNGTVYITGGTITSQNYAAVHNASGTLTIGTPGGALSTTEPLIQGKTYGVLAYSSYNFYDGILKGQTGAIAIASGSGTNPTATLDTNKTKIANHEVDTQYVDATDGNYSVLYLDYDSTKYKITLDTRGGQITGSNIILVEPTDPIGAIPTPTKGAYIFAGWVDGNNNPVDDTTVPTGDLDIYAVWTFTPTHGTLNIINDAMTAYYNGIGTWKNNESTFLTSMEANFNNYSCLSCDAGSNYQSCPASGEVQCDRPNGYATGVTGTLNVYEAVETTQNNVTTWTKGNTQATYVTVTSDGTIYDMIPGKTYYWELASDNNIYGTVTVSGARRIVEAGTVRNIRDLGGLEVDVDRNGTIDGVIDYGRMFRGPKLNSSDDVLSLQTLGVTEEIDLRGSQSDPKLSNYVPREIRNYEISPEFNNGTYYNQFRQAVSDTIDDILAHENVYFHCAIGTDRTGTMAWFLEGLLGVSEEDRVEDYELSYFYGLLNRHRFYRNQPGSSITHRFEYMYQTYPTNLDIYNYYTNNGTEHVQQVQAFRDEVITYNSTYLNSLNNGN